MKPATYIRAMRLPFVGASALPFIFGTFTGSGETNWFVFLLGLIAVVSTHLSANLINDYADNQSGADCQDQNYYTFFGGSKLIQEGVLSPSFYLKLSICFAFLAIISLIGLLLTLANFWLVIIISGALFLALQYSCQPLALSYHGLGETVIMFLFGPFCVLGGAYLQNSGGVNINTFAISFIYGLLTAAILISNEIPDAATDAASKKNTLVVILGADKGWLLYLASVALAYILLIGAILSGAFNWFSVLAIPAIILPIKAVQIMRQSGSDKFALTESSRLVILHQMVVGIILIIALV